MSSYKTLIQAALIGMAALSVLTCIESTQAQEMMRRDSGARGDGMRGGDRGGGMRGVGTGIGIGIGTGLAIDAIERSRQADDDAPRRGTKKTKGSKELSKKRLPRNEPEGQTAMTPSQLKFVGKPDDVVHNPLQKEGKLGDLTDHKQAVVSKDGSLFKRHYYFTREGDQRTWFYYDVPITRNDPVIKQFKEVRNCGENDDNCDGPPPVYVDDKPAPGEIIEDKVDCPGGVIRVNMATSTCVNGKVQLHEDHYNYCPPDKTNYHHTHKDIPTETVCGEGAVAWTPGLDDLHGKACGTAIDTGDTIMHPEDIGGIWVITVYKVYTCTGIPGQRFVGDPEKFSDGKVADGPPKPNLDPAKLAPPGPI